MMKWCVDKDQRFDAGILRLGRLDDGVPRDRASEKHDFLQVEQINDFNDIRRQTSKRHVIAVIAVSTAAPIRPDNVENTVKMRGQASEGLATRTPAMKTQKWGTRALHTKRDPCSILKIERAHNSFRSKTDHAEFALAITRALYPAFGDGTSDRGLFGLGQHNIRGSDVLFEMD
jgi:hypothetical protein